MDFLNNYLLKNNVKEIKIRKDMAGGDAFAYRAEITTSDDDQFYMTLGSYENFLAKLDMVQREMGKLPDHFIPIKYESNSDANR